MYPVKSFICFLLLLAATTAAYCQPYKNLVLKGGGIRGIAYTGAVEVLEEKKVMQGIENVAGTSAGAIVAAMICAGYTAGEMKEMMFAMHMEAFNDGQWFFIGGQKRLRKNFGWYKGVAIEQWIGELLQRKTGNAAITFAQLHELALKDHRFKDPYITATNLTQQKAEVFSWRTYPGMAVKTAVRASSAIPLYYSAVILDSSGRLVRNVRQAQNYNVYVDGGILENYPVSVFDSGNITNRYTLGLSLQRPEQIAYSDSAQGLAPYKIKTFKNYMSAFYNVIIENLNKTSPGAQERSRTIYISTGNISQRVRSMPLEQKTVLYNNGRVAAASFFSSTHTP